MLCQIKKTTNICLTLVVLQCWEGNNLLLTHYSINIALLSPKITPYTLHLLSAPY